MRIARLPAIGAISSLAIFGSCAPLLAQHRGQAMQARLEPIAQFPHQVTGVAVSLDGRIFVNFPRWTEDSPISVAEVSRDGSFRPYPNREWNAWRNARRDELAPNAHFICVQSVVADKRGNLWVLDPAAPAQGNVVAQGPKLVRIDLANNRVAQTISFDETVAPQGSYLNDVRFTDDGRHAFITDSGAIGAIVVVNLQNERARRVLDGDPSTQSERGLVVKTDGRELRRPDGRGVEFAADGIALSPDGQHLYWQAIKGKTLYRIAVADLIAKDEDNDRNLGQKVENFGINGVSDGLLIARANGRMYISALEEDAVKTRDLSQGAQSQPQILVKDRRLRWPDSFAEGPNGEIYVTTSRIQDSAFFKRDAPIALQTQLWRIVGNGEEATGSTQRRERRR